MLLHIEERRKRAGDEPARRLWEKASLGVRAVYNERNKGSDIRKDNAVDGCQEVRLAERLGEVVVCEVNVIRLLDLQLQARERYTYPCLPGCTSRGRRAWRGPLARR